MCGIVGYIGKGDIQNKLIQGLQRLEYRGYDSAGLSLCDKDEQLHVLKRAGKLTQLQTALPNFIKNIPSNIIAGIAHTRWATHGVPNEINAHPHVSSSGLISVVHNGIIENYAILKEKLIEEGVHFESDTDTEVIAQLIEYQYKGDLYEAVVATLELIEGAYGIAVQCKKEPDILVVAKKGSPLIIGLADQGTYVSSDVLGVVQDTQKVIHLQDFDVATLSLNNPPIIHNLKNEPTKHEVTTVDFHLGDISKGGFPDFMLKEIHEQPDTIRNAIRGRTVLTQGTAKLSGMNGNPYEIANIKQIIIVACGTSRFAGMVGEYIIEHFSGIPVKVEHASEFRYRNPIINPNTVVFAISQSGETADTLAALQEAKLKGAKVFGIVNSVSSAIAREAGQGIYLHAGPEISVASTKAFTSQVTVMYLLGLLLGRTKRLGLTEGQNIIKNLENLPTKIEHILQNSQKKIFEVAQYLKNIQHVFYIGRSYNFPTALEGALKLKEISYIHAEGYEAAELKHGPIALLDENTPVIALMNQQMGYEKMISTINEVQARKAPVICIATSGNKELQQYSKYIIEVPECPEAFSPLLNVVALQLLAYETAKAKKLNVDQPRNLAKSVTVE